MSNKAFHIAVEKTEADPVQITVGELAMRFLYRNRLEARHWVVLEQDRVMHGDHGAWGKRASPTFAILTSHFLLAARPSRANAVLAFLFHFEYAT